ncbi:hypothetical protein ACTNDO_12105, partial [Anaerobiospirillum succiniciproducens]
LLDETYPKGKLIKVVLDNHRAHTSKETKAYIDSTPNHSSACNLVPKSCGFMSFCSFFFTHNVVSMIKIYHVQKLLDWLENSLH